jgi:hypothetical protein
MTKAFILIRERNIRCNCRTRAARWCGSSILLVGDEPSILDKFGGPRMVRVVVVVFIDDGMNHHGLFVDCEGRVRRHCDPRFYFC